MVTRIESRVPRHWPIVAAVLAVVWLPTGCDEVTTPLGSPSITQEMVIVRGALSVAHARMGHRVAAFASEDYECDDVQDCFDKCPEPTGGGSTICTCEANSSGGFTCDVERLGPGDDPPDNGGTGDGERDDDGECGDERDDMAAEYARHGGLGLWRCTDFRSSGGVTNFSWSELNGRWAGGNEAAHKPWGFVASALTDGLVATRAYYNRGGILVSSGYRCPDGNIAVGGVIDSEHMKGRAADMYSNDRSWTETEFNRLRAAAVEAGGNALFWSTYSDRHLHVSW